jgi:hypothetical protein
MLFADRLEHNEFLGIFPPMNEDSNMFCKPAKGLPFDCTVHEKNLQFPLGPFYKKAAIKANR